MFKAEGTKRAWQQRMVNLRSFYPPGIPFWSRHVATEKLDSPAGDMRMRVALTTIQPSLLVLDPIAEFLHGTDTDAVAVQRWTAVVNGWRETFGCAVVLVHHDRQRLQFALKGSLTTLDAGMDEARGHTRLPAWADWVVGMRRKDDTTTVRVQKVRDAPDGQEFVLKLSEGRLVTVGRSDAIELGVIAAIQGGDVWLADVCRAVTTSLGTPDRTIRRAIDRLIEAGDVAQIKEGGRFKLELTKDGL